MFKIDSANSVTSMPAVGAAGTPGFFQDGNASTGTQGTVVSAAWLNTVQTELMNILAAAGVSASKASQNQVITSLQSLFGGSGSNAHPGYRRLGGNVIVQYGNGLTTAAQLSSPFYDVVSFGTAFPAACIAVSVNEGNAGGGWVSSPNTFTVFGPSNVTTTGFRLYCKTATINGSSSSVANAGGVAYSFIALGY